MKKWALILGTAMFICFLAAGKVLAAPTNAVSQFRSADLTLERAPDGSISLEAGAAYRWQIAEGRQLILGTNGVFIVTSPDFIDWWKVEAEYRFRKAQFSLTIPLSYKWEPDKSSVKGGFSLDKKMDNSALGVACNYAHQWADNELLISDKVEGNASLTASTGAWLDQKFQVDSTVLLKPNDAEDDYLRVLAGWTGWFRPTKASTLKTTLEWTSYWYWNDPRENRQRYETALEYSLRLKNLSFKVGGEGEYGTGRLSDHYLALQGWTGLILRSKLGRISIDGRLSGKNYKDPATTARDSTGWQVALGYQHSLGSVDFRLLAYYGELHYEDGTGKWVFGPLASCKWHITDHWQISFYWAPQGNLSQDEKGLRLSLAWRA